MGANSRQIPEALLRRHRAFWQMKEVEKPLLRVREYRPLGRGGHSFGAAGHFHDNQRIAPDLLTEDVLAVEEPQSLIDGDLIEGLQPPGLCWTEAFVGCPLEMGTGGVWADSFIANEEELRRFLETATPEGCNPWLARFEASTRLSVQNAGGRFPVVQPLMRGPIDMMASGLGHCLAATAFLDFPAQAGAMLDRCADLFITMAQAHLRLVPAFHGGQVMFGIWTPGPVVRTQLDNAVLFSPSMYRDHYLPRDRRVFRSFEYVIIHVHSGSLHIAGDLAAEADLNAVQVSLDVPAGPSVPQMLATLQMIQESKPLVVTGPATRAEIDLLLNGLKPSGLCIDVRLKNG